jgi:hypothetical protein
MGMIRNLVQRLGARRTGILLAAVTSVAAIGAAPATAQADSNWRIGISIGDDYHRRPRYEERVTRVWVPPTYRTVCERTWVPASYRTECVRVWVPDRYEEQTIIRGHGHHRRVEHVRVLVERGHYAMHERQVLVSPGHWENVERQVMVCEGRWEQRVERVAMHDHHRDSRIRVGFGHR